jgi:PAS domain S-box-containing protein
MNMEMDSAGGDGAATDIQALVSELARAERELANAVAGKVDSIVDPAGKTYLLREAQQALLRSEAEAKEQAALLNAVFESATDLITYIGTDGQILYGNRIPRPGSSENIVGAHWLSLALPDLRQRMKQAFDRAIATGDSTSFDSHGPGTDEKVSYYSRRFSPVRRDGEVVGVVIVTRDITEQKNAEAQLMASDRMASVGCLAAGVAHEINNPLASVVANIELALQQLKLLGRSNPAAREIEEELRDARGAAERMRLIVRDLKIFSRAEEDKCEPLDLEKVIESTLRMACNEIRHRARLVKEYGGVPLVHANESRLGQVFLNLLVNAAQAIPEGKAQDNTIRISTSLESDGRVLVRVSDTGPGIPADVGKRLFTPFFTTKPVGAGTGLGLSICQRIVTSLGGEISFVTEVGKGTEFRVALPVAERQVTVPPASRAATPASRRGRVLVVDDEVAVGVVAKRILCKEHEVVTVNEPSCALAMLEQGERFDVVLCDLMMPEMTGMDLHDKATEIDTDQARRFVFVTGGAFTPRARTFLDSNSNHRIEKPFDVQGLKAIVNGLIR